MQFSGPAALSFSTDRSYKLLGRQLWAVLSSEKSRSPATAIKVGKSRHNSRTALRIKLLHVPDRDNIEFYVLCKFQCSTCSVCRKTDVKDGMTNKQTNKRTTVCLRPRHNDQANFLSLKNITSLTSTIPNCCPFFVVPSHTTGYSLINLVFNMLL